MSQSGGGAGLRLAFVLPTKNEQATVGDTVAGLQDLCRRHGWQCEVVVADDSDDETASISRRLGAHVVDGGRAGLGQAMARGLSAALGLSPHWVISMDADGQVDLEEIPVFLSLAQAQNADVVISSRFLSRTSFDYPYPLVNWIGNRILVGILRIATGRGFTDSHGGIRIMRPEAIRGLRLIGRHTYVQETLIQMHRRGNKIIEVPSRWKPRLNGDSRVLHSIFRYAYRTSPALLCHLRFPLVAALGGSFLALEAIFLRALPHSVSLLAAVTLMLLSVALLAHQQKALRIESEGRP